MRRELLPERIALGVVLGLVLLLSVLVGYAARMLAPPTPVVQPDPVDVHPVLPGGML